MLIATVIAPACFSYVLHHKFKDKPRSGVTRFKIEASGKHHTGMTFEIADVLHALHLDIVEVKVNTDGTTDHSVWDVEVTELADELDHEKIHELEKEIVEAIGDPSTQISLIPVLDTDTVMINKQ